jgi:membrane protein implicated in regulation of membrane protease activity
MEPYLIWIAAGFALIIVELVTGTFYLLVIGGGAFAGAAVAAAGGGYLLQAVAACAVALAGTWYVRRWHDSQKKAGEEPNLLDLGQPVALESWTDAATGRARVKYRGASWDGRVAEAVRPEPGATLYILGQEGNALLLGTTPPAGPR